MMLSLRTIVIRCIPTISSSECILCVEASRKTMHGMYRHLNLRFGQSLDGPSAQELRAAMDRANSVLPIARAGAVAADESRAGEPSMVVARTRGTRRG